MFDDAVAVAMSCLCDDGDEGNEDEYVDAVFFDNVMAVTMTCICNDDDDDEEGNED